MILRDYQSDILEQLMSSTTNDLVQLDTGAGKTPIEAALAQRLEHCIVVAHRNILIEQISEKLAAFGIDHDTISTAHTRRRCRRAHRRHGRSFICRGHQKTLVASVASLHAQLSRGRLTIDQTLPWTIVIDEAHHVVPDNQWGALKTLFPAARIIGFTATPARFDGQPLHISCGGLFERLVQAKSLLENSTVTLIERGYLAGFVYYSPETTIKHLHSRKALRIAADPVEQYKKLASGLKTIAICPSIANAEELARLFREADIPAARISSDQSPTEIARALDAFAAGRIQVLTNVDMVTEGFDMPDAQALLLLRLTGSFVAYRQWVGRVLRPAPTKQRAVIIDLVDNAGTHGLPDDPVVWDILAPPKGLSQLRKSPCSACGAWFSVIASQCPECAEINALLTRDDVGGHYVALKPLDIAMISQARRERSDAALREHFEREIVWPIYIDSDGTSVGSVLHKLRHWLVDAVDASGEPRVRINAFLSSPSCHDKAWWMRRFTIRDLAGSTDKALKEFRRWNASN